MKKKFSVRLLGPRPTALEALFSGPPLQGHNAFLGGAIKKVFGSGSSLH